MQPANMVFSLFPPVLKIHLASANVGPGPTQGSHHSAGAHLQACVSGAFASLDGVIPSEARDLLLR